jgi:hypothetical protein
MRARSPSLRATHVSTLRRAGGTRMTTVGVLHPGEMGSAVGAAAVAGRRRGVPPARGLEGHARAPVRRRRRQGARAVTAIRWSTSRLGRGSGGLGARRGQSPERAAELNRTAPGPSASTVTSSDGSGAEGGPATPRSSSRCTPGNRASARATIARSSHDPFVPMVARGGPFLEIRHPTACPHEVPAAEPEPRCQAPASVRMRSRGPSPRPNDHSD